MALDTILSIAQKPGLYKLVTQTRGGLIAQSLIDGKRISVSLRNNISLLSEIAVFTLTEEKPLSEVFLKIKEKENGGKTSVNHKDSKDDIEEYFFEVLPDYDEDRVYVSDIKKIIKWYNLLHESDLLDTLDKKEVSDDEEE